MKDLNTFVDENVDDMLKSCKKDMYTICTFEDLLIFSSSGSIINLTLEKVRNNSDNEGTACHQPKSEVIVGNKKEQG
eukprot:11377891-Ditylum_brightwellii.AAC.1